MCAAFCSGASIALTKHSCLWNRPTITPVTVSKLVGLTGRFATQMEATWCITQLWRTTRFLTALLCKKSCVLIPGAAMHQFPPDTSFCSVQLVLSVRCSGYATFTTVVRSSCICLHVHSAYEPLFALMCASSLSHLPQQGAYQMLSFM